MDTYIVKKGDTVESIAEYYNVSVFDIISANSLVEPYNIVEGMTLNIPYGITNIYDYYIVKKNDTLYKIATNANTNVDIIAAINGLGKGDYIYQGQTLLIPKKNFKTYITKNGDTIETVANYFKTNPQDILYSNGNIFLLPDQLLVYRQF